MKHMVFSLVATLAITGCASLEMEPVASTHPGHPDAEAGFIPGLPDALQVQAGGQNDIYDAHAVHSEHDGYVCPMHPEVRAMEPSTCHICGMDLVPAEDAS